MSHPPNLLFLMTDQQRSDTVDPASPCLTPYLDSLAAAGTRFTRCYAPSPICSPTRASLFTGLLPHNHGMVDVTHAVERYRASFRSELPVWPQTLQAAGYHTAYFGKWHVERSNQLERFGFDVYDVKRYRQQKDFMVKSAPLELRGSVSQKGYDDFLLYGVTDRPVEEMSEYHLYSDSIDFLRRAASDPNRPWALFVSSEAPHDPYLVPTAHYERYDPETLPRPASFEDDLAHRPGIYRRIQRVWQAMAWPQFAQAIACYYAFCSMVDDQIGRLLAVLEELGQLEQTLIVFTSDHGDYLGAHRLMLKGIPAFEEAYRVPLILTGPAVPKGRVVDHIVSHLDLAPTLSLLTTGSDFSCQGRSLFPLLGTGDAQWLDEAYAECHGQRFYYTQRVVWQDSWKYVFNGFDLDELYDLDADPHELHNLAADPAYRVVLETLAGRMWHIARKTKDSNLVDAQYGMFRFAPVGPVEP